MAGCVVWFLCLAAVVFAGDESQCPEPQSILRLPGHATVYGLFDAHAGDNCSDPSVIGLQQMAAAAWMVSSLNQVSYVPGVKLGLALYDGCFSVVGAQKTLLAAVIDLTCDSSYDLGLVTSPSITSSLQTLPQDLNVSLFFSPEPHIEKLLISTAVSLMSSLNWTTVGWVLAASVETLNSFNHESVNSRLCVLQETILPASDKQNWTGLLEGPLSSLSQDSVVVVIGSWQQIVDSLHVAQGFNISLQWIIIPIDNVKDFSNLAVLPADALIVLPGVGIQQEEEETHIHMYDANVMNSAERLLISYPLFMQVALPLLETIDRFKAALSTHCGENSSLGICNNMPQYNILPKEPSPSASRQILDLLNSNSRVVLSAVSRVTGGSILEEIAVYENGLQETAAKLKVIANIHSNVPHDELCSLRVGYNVTPGRDCRQCSNFVHYHLVQRKQMVFGGIFAGVSWRSDAWVAAVASIGAVGITCCLVIMIFLTVRICKGDILEGNPGFSYLMIFSIIFTYCATLPFSLDVHDPDHFMENLFCSLRITGTSISYAMLFSIMFSRSVMLASCDQDGGFMSHVNGYVQSVLCFFVLGVQIALSTQFWIINTTFLDPSQCASMYEGYYFQILLCYDIFLLILVVCTSPFTIRSKRNYREGIYFTVASILSLFIWVGWTTAYLLSPREWQDAAISGGLAATATAILVTVFIPRTYMMMTAIVRDNLATALPSLACANSTSVLDLNYRAASQQVLYDCINPVLPYSVAHVNPNFYSDHPEMSSNLPFKTTPHIRSSSPENLYQQYDSPASPNKVTHF